jgi:hypothetical protein
MFLGKTEAAIDLLSRHERGSVLSLSDVIEDKTVHEILISKHPPAQPPHPEAIIFPDIEPPTVHPIIYESIDAERIRWAALHTFGAAGPSGSDASCWKRLCTAFKRASDDLCLALSQFSKRLCTSYVDPVCLSPWLACRLIALNKDPGVRPIGICEVVRRIVAKAVLSVTRHDILDSAGSLQLCTSGE